MGKEQAVPPHEQYQQKVTGHLKQNRALLASLEDPFDIYEEPEPIDLDPLDSVVAGLGVSHARELLKNDQIRMAESIGQAPTDYNPDYVSVYVGRAITVLGKCDGTLALAEEVAVAGFPLEPVLSGILALHGLPDSEGLKETEGRSNRSDAIDLFKLVAEEDMNASNFSTEDVDRIREIMLAGATLMEQELVHDNADQSGVAAIRDIFMLARDSVTEAEVFRQITQAIKEAIEPRLRAAQGVVLTMNHFYPG